ncbi:uncharacterized protein LOC9640771 [Selaginella moellendorffii]|uniref:uncharacterized protein LOC9640771 n=1 Tax=Selaginella moellendorffii TaxID=88036 RepID=UPI000D1C84B2|nr:uncharacterized protein LOC9640771 [Selaginella moellendorffii]|eukprot:XP_024515532.1 uncharacterized protein LOC9640771 [Selaginella moellendorffii]
MAPPSAVTCKSRCNVSITKGSQPNGKEQGNQDAEKCKHYCGKCTHELPSCTGHSFHPLDPLQPSEIVAAAHVIKTALAPTLAKSGVINFIEVILDEPEKMLLALYQCQLQVKHNHQQLVRPSRQARLTVYNAHNNETSLWVVELPAAPRAPKVLWCQYIPDVQPPVVSFHNSLHDRQERVSDQQGTEEYVLCEAIVKSHKPLIEALRKRGITNTDLIMVDTWCTGYHEEKDAPSRRLARPLMFYRTESSCPMENGYARPIEGLSLLVDLQNMNVVELEEREAAPLPPPDPMRNYTPACVPGGLRTDVKPLQILQPGGPSFEVNGYEVTWQKWSFRLGFTPREGLVIHTVAYSDGSRGPRSVAHRLSFVEMIVPYGDPAEPHYRKNAFDVGEDGLGRNAHSLKKGCDCLGYIHYFDAYLTDQKGDVETLENAICLHEEDNGILWKHKDWRTGLSEVRRSRRLTVSFICTVANYDYGFYWHFYQDGKIEAEVKLTGILSLGAIQPGEQRKNGTVISTGLYAPIHQHFFVARMNMAVDSKPGEAENQVVEVNVVPEPPGPNNPHCNAFYAKETLLKSEMQAQRDCNPLSARHWIVRNTKVVNRAGGNTGYKLVPGANCLGFIGKDAMILRRAEFLKHNLWVTSYSKDELYPAGEFPKQNPRIGEGLPTWVKKDRDLENADIVLWYVFGVTHIPRLEDWPVMPVERIGFTLTPHGFFDCCPAIDVPPNQNGA